MLLVRTFRYCTIPLVDEELSCDGRAAFIEELADLLAAYLIAPRPWSDEE